MENKNLSLINIMSNNNNNKFVNYVQTLANDRLKVKKQNRKLYDEATALYVNRQIAQKRSLELITNALILNKDIDKVKAKILKQYHDEADLKPKLKQGRPKKMKKKYLVKINYKQKV